MYGSLTLLDEVEVATDLLVTGLVGRGMWLDLAHVTVNLHQNTQIEGVVLILTVKNSAI